MSSSDDSDSSSDFEDIVVPVQEDNVYKSYIK